jgi:hypothetical protein
MADHDEDFTPPKPRSRLRFVRNVMLVVLGITGVVALVLYLGRWQMGRQGEERLRVETSKLDAEDPGWRLDAILAARAQPGQQPDTVAAAVPGLSDGVPVEWRTWHREKAFNWFSGGRTANRLPAHDTTEGARKYAADTLLVRTDAVRLRDKPPGAFPLVFPADPLTLTLPHLDQSRRVMSLLQYDAYLSAIDRNPNRGVNGARSVLAIARAIGDEPFLISQLARRAAGSVAAETLHQVLCWGEPTEGLAEVQAELLAEADAPVFLYGMRGERAILDRLFRGLADGSIPAETWFKYMDINNPGPEHYALYRAYRPLMAGDHAKALELTSRYVEAAKLPTHEQLAALKAVRIPAGPPDEVRYLLSRRLLPACERVADASIRVRAVLLVSATGVACERFRQKNGRWPRELAELVPALLPAVPTSPFDTTPLHYRTFEDRIAIYFHWAESTRNLDNVPADFRDGHPPGESIGFRLWNHDRRGLPPEEKKKT